MAQSFGVNNRGRDWPHLFVVLGDSKHLANWTDLKDFVRRIVEGQPGWTEAGGTNPRFNEHISRGYVNSGYFSLKSDSDAVLAFEKLTSHIENSRRLIVHHFDCSLDPEWRLLKCNCAQVFGTAYCTLPPAADTRPVAQAPATPASPPFGAYYTPYTAAGVGYQTVSNPYSATMDPMAGLTNAFSNLSTDPGIYAPTQYYAAPTAGPTPTLPAGYIQNSSNMPVNVSHGVVVTEHRSVHISGIPYSFDEDGLSDFIFRKARVDPIKVTLRRDRSSKRSNGGSGTAAFKTVEEARVAVKRLNGCKVKNQTLRVKLDRDATPITAPAPTIVDSPAL